MRERVKRFAGGVVRLICAVFVLAFWYVAMYTILGIVKILNCGRR